MSNKFEYIRIETSLLCKSLPCNKTILFFLLKNIGTFHGTISDLSDILNTSADSIGRWLAEFETAGIVKREYHGGNKVSYAILENAELQLDKMSNRNLTKCQIAILENVKSQSDKMSNCYKEKETKEKETLPHTPYIEKEKKEKETLVVNSGNANADVYNASLIDIRGDISSEPPINVPQESFQNLPSSAPTPTPSPDDVVLMAFTESYRQIIGCEYIPSWPTQSSDLRDISANIRSTAKADGYILTYQSAASYIYNLIKAGCESDRWLREKLSLRIFATHFNDFYKAYKFPNRNERNNLTPAQQAASDSIEELQRATAKQLESIGIDVSML